MADTMNRYANTPAEAYYAEEHGESDPDGLAWAEPHPHDREAYYVFAELMGWRAEWEDLGTVRDIPGPGQLPFIAAFRRVRELMGGKVADGFTVGLVDHWGEWLAGREKRKAERPVKVRKSRPRATQP